MVKKTLIIGGVAGGATTAARLRRRDESMQIIIFERGEYISYANCGLPYYIGDVIQSRDALLLQKPEAMLKKYRIDVRIKSEVIKIISEENKIVVKNIESQETYEETYDNLVIATGSSPIVPPIEGIDADNIFTLWTIPDTDYIKGYITERKPQKAAVIGGGFIGLEMAENLVAAGLEVTLIEMQNQVMAPLDLDMANLLHENIIKNGVRLVLEDGVKAFHHENENTIIQLNSGNKIETDLVILSIGVRPNSKLAKEAGIHTNERGGIQVNEYLQTSKENIYAVGDVIEVNQYVTNNKTMIPLAGPANKQARIAADNITGLKQQYQGTLGSAVAKVFDLNAASVGINEKQLIQMGKQKNKDYFTVLINQRSHAGYYPGATPITLKLLFEEKGKILGAQIVGQDGVDKRIDTIASTMRLHGTVFDLADLELAYAPPFSSAKDPVNMLGFVAENILDQMVSFIEWDELDALIDDTTRENSFTILDVTEDIERLVYEIPKSYHIPLGELRSRISELDRNKLIIPYCAIGVRSYNAARILMQNGFAQVAVLSGGTKFYKSMHYKQAGQQNMNQDRGIENHTNQDSGIENRTNQDNGKQDHTNQDSIKYSKVKVLDCCGLQCPGPIMKVNEAISKMKDSEVLEVSATDMGFAADIEAWCRRTGNTLLATSKNDKENIITIQKGKEKSKAQTQESNESEAQSQERNEIVDLQGKTIIVFSGDLDKVLASFIIANGAAAMGRKVTMFFTFWGLNVLRKAERTKIKKPFIDRMFGRMMPRGSKKLKLSKMNMAGMGTSMMKKVMNDKNVDSLEDLIKKAMENGVKMIACTMSMDIMGIQKEELIDGVEFAGVASYLGDAEESNVNLFI